MNAAKSVAEKDLRVDYALCHVCGACVAECAQDAMFLRSSGLNINQERCTACERCLRACPVHALSLVDRSSPRPI